MALEPPRTGGSRTMGGAPMGRWKTRGLRSDRGYGRGSRPFGLGPYDAGSGGAERDGIRERAWERRSAHHRRPVVGGSVLRTARRLPRAGRGARSRRLRGGEPRSRGFLGRTGAGAHLDAAVGHRDGLGSAVGDVVRRRTAQRVGQLLGPPRRRRWRRQGGVLLGG